MPPRRRFSPSTAWRSGKIGIWLSFLLARGVLAMRPTSVEAARSGVWGRRPQRPSLLGVRSRALRLAASCAAIVLLGLGAFGGCGLSTEGIPGGCTDNLACPAPDPCKVGSCGSDGKCAFNGLPDGLPPVQI